MIIERAITNDQHSLLLLKGPPARCIIGQVLNVQALSMPGDSAVQTPFILLKLVAKALGNAIGGGIAGDVIVEVLPGLAKDVWDQWKKDRNGDQRRTEVEAIVQAGGEEVRRLVPQIVEEVLVNKAPEIRQMVAIYLNEVPTCIRRSLRRPSDPAGKTVPPDLVPRNANELLRMLPSKLPRFKPGEQPLPGVDWRLQELLGVGGFGEVWKARNPNLASAPPVRVKFCLDKKAAKELRNEAWLLDRVMRHGKHPGIVQLLQYLPQRRDTVPGVRVC